MRIDLDYNINNMETSVNNKCKAFTSLEQSRKLAGILPLESADMIYTMVNGYHTPFIRIETIEEMYEEDVLCWSLAALLSVLPYPFLSELSNGIWKCGCYPSGICNYVTADSPIDACYEMILHLHELKML